MLESGVAQYISGTDRRQPMLLPASVDDYISDDNPVRALDAFVDSLDPQKLGFDVRHDSSKGRPGYAPATLIKLFLWGYLNRCRSSRALEDACCTNLSAIWLTGNLRPDHSTISDFRKTNAKPLKEIFREFNLLCIKLDLFGRELVAIDGTFIKAVNSKARSFTKAKLVKLIAAIDKAVTGYLEQLESFDALEDRSDTQSTSKAELQEKLAKIKERKATLEGYLRQCHESPTGQVSLTDPDSVQLCKGDKRTVGYNVQSAVDAKHHLVAAVEVTQDGNDMHQLNSMAQKAKEGMGLEPKARIKATADKGYGTGSELASCERNHTETYVSVQKKKSEANGFYNQEDFLYDSGSDSYQCPAGAVLKRGSDRQCGETVHRIYENRGACKDCSLKAQCTNGTFRRLQISEHQEVIDRAKKRLLEAPEMMIKRHAVAEHPFGTIKDRNGRHDLLCRGKEQAAAETGMSFWAYNFTRVINLQGIKALIEAIVSRKGPVAA